ncbi:PREDICTED: uncharacterized protein LOC106750979 [Dinoponera quadriceps]|uniref:Uncharacterized protein LOC106750979 n=1 Tax=Dinoponera quadriceps TaxID=609295 RepID=A0A6P3YAZ6_DINQU|nr:PREDICTED: uncharacterized protein LOC106750979 [Dinoponera quadriceps]
MVLVIVEMLPVILDAVAPMKASRPHKIIIDFEMFLDKQQYFYAYLMVEIVMAAVGFSTIIAISSLLIAFFRHSCAIFKISSILIGNTVTKHSLEIPHDRKTREMYRRITRAVCSPNLY